MTQTASLADRAGEAFLSLQQRICARLEELDGEGLFLEDPWKREGGGGGITRVMTGGAVFEKAGVNWSDVHGDLPKEMAGQLPGQGDVFRATGVSLVLHPCSPMVPTVHANFRFLSRGAETAWFGGGADLTPYYLWIDDAVHFHRTWKEICDRHDETFYPRFKKWCDEYFFLPHRGETRGVGGIFFDYLTHPDPETIFAFVRDAGQAFLPAYVPIAERRKDEPYGESERAFQLWRRGRYAEFNLLYDRGTLFGLKTQGRIESILMSLPPLASWPYGAQAIGIREAELLANLRPRDWLASLPIHHM